MQLQLRTDDNNRTPRVIDAFAEEVLAETAALALEHIAQRFQRPITRACNGATMPAVVEQSVHGLLEHSLFVSNDDVRRLEQKQVFESVVTIDHPTIKIVQVRSRETPAFERNQGTQIRRNHRQHIQNHPLGARVRILKALNELETLGQFLANLFALCGAHRFLQLFVELVKVDLGQKLPDRLGAHAGNEIFAILLLRLAVLDFVEQLCLLQRRFAGINNDVILVINNALQLACAHIEHEPDARRHALVKPNVRDRHCQFDVSHAFTTYARQGDFDAAAITDHSLVFDALVFSARALPIPCRTKNTFAEKAALLRLERAVIDRLRIFDFAFAPRPHRVAGGNTDRNLIKTHGALFAH